MTLSICTHTMSDAEQREETIFDAALRLPSDQRAAYLENVCEGDADLRRRVQILLSAFERAGGFLKDPPTLPMEPKGTTRALAEKPGYKIGRYKLLEQIGEGGCGVVYVAEQEAPVRRKVALKVVKLGMDTKQVIARFDAERQALAMMDHPNIAKVHDAGATETGRPYFVMELVRGIRITQFCDENQLSTGERLDLFVQVCRAVQHAHQKGIIHRDIKPSNILVTVNDGVPVPKVIDFGIAKATQGRLTDQTIYTAFEQFLGTPAYMSPEQATMTSLDIDTRTDIYSLGVLLYELLTGTTPFDARELLAKGLDEMRRTILQIEPVKPSTRLTQERHAQKIGKTEIRNPKSEIHQDLDWIVMKCLEKDRSRRYETANGLATDIQRFLKCEPVVARPPSRLYEFQKTVRRHKFGFAAAAALIIVLALGAIVSTTQAVRATRAEHAQNRLLQIAETSQKRSEQTARFLKDMLTGVQPSVALGRDTTMLREIVDKTAARVDKDLNDQPEVQIELRSLLADIYHELGLYRQMEEMASGTVAMARRNFGPESVAGADGLVQLGDALQHLGSQKDAEASLRQAIELQKRLRGPESLQLARAYYHLSVALDGKPQPSEAENLSREALAMRRKLLGSEHADVARSLDQLGFVLFQQRRFAEAESSLRESLAMRKRLCGDDCPDLGRSYSLLGDLFLAQGKSREAEAMFRNGLEIGRKLHGGETQFFSQSKKLAELLRARGDLAEAESLYQDILPASKKIGNRETTSILAMLASIARERGDLHNAQEWVDQAVNLCNQEANEIEGWRQNIVFDEFKATLLATGRASGLEQATRQFVQNMRVRSPTDDHYLAVALANLADIYRERGDLSQARSLVEEALAAAESKPDLRETWERSKAIGVLRKTLAAMSDTAGLEPSAARFLQDSRATFSNGDPWLILPLCDLAEAMVDNGKALQARPLAQEAMDICEQRSHGLADWMRSRAYWTLRRVLLELGDDAELARLEPIRLRELRESAEHGDLDALNGLAWSLATSTDAKLRDGTNAVALAERAVAKTNRKNAQYLDTLAAAYAEIGQFQQAVRLQSEAISLVTPEEAAKTYLARLRLYESNSPARERH
ncbi:MAG: serine/threonine protein kinase [Verrucomicrobia bacterium]|nr:MAG: serine/threonine protein kinase [Verrucomicrobiota bacterium]